VLAFDIEETTAASGTRYALKRVTMKLGPAGFVFERYVVRTLESYGYATEVGKHVLGYCVMHEIDVSAKKKRAIIFW